MTYDESRLELRKALEAAGVTVWTSGLDEVVRRLGMRGNMSFRGRLRVTRMNGEVLVDSRNMVVNAGLEALVDALQSAAYVNDFHYIAFGTNTVTSAVADTGLGVECTGGTYYRMNGTQGEGDNAREYRITGTWTNTTGSTQAVTEYGILSSATWGAGTLLARVVVGDSGAPITKTLENNETVAVTWDIQLADA